MRVALAIAVITLTLGLILRPMQGQMPISNAQALQTIDMVDALTGWAVTDKGANSLLRTADGGTIWFDVTPVDSPPERIRVRAVAVLTSHIAWVASEALARATKIFRTTDGGRTWKSVIIPASDVSSIHFINDHVGWLLSIEGALAGSNSVAVYHSTDGGRTWVKISESHVPDTRSGLIGGYKRAVTFLDAATGWVTGSDINPNTLPLSVTHDGGRTWRPQKLPLPSAVASRWLAASMPPRFFTARDGIVPVFYFGEDPVSYVPIGSIVVVYATSDRGVTWQLTTPVSVARHPNSWNFVDSKHGWVAEGDVLYVTSDGGHQWSAVRPSAPFAAARNLDFISTQVGWAVRETFPFLLKTVNGGRTWTPVTYTISR